MSTSPATPAGLGRDERVLGRAAAAELHEQQDAARAAGAAAGRDAQREAAAQLAGTATGPATTANGGPAWSLTVRGSAKMRSFVTAATVIASAALPGDETVPLAALVALVAGGDDGRDARTGGAGDRACSTRSSPGPTSGSPSERFSTSMPSATARSIARAISAPFPSSPNEGVGVVSTR